MVLHTDKCKPRPALYQGQRLLRLQRTPFLFSVRELATNSGAPPRLLTGTRLCPIWPARPSPQPTQEQADRLHVAHSPEPQPRRLRPPGNRPVQSLRAPESVDVVPVRCIGLLLFRFADCRFCGLRNRDPPWTTLNSPHEGPLGFCEGLFL
jgi:hypothetical protein